ncbi:MULTISPECIES: hypothetical protein [Pasteurellaceae]|uniref:Uncharacterized protein n=1 Tax=Pasteurella atlantica TaxID=2827233 RepID=A0AAW8CFJ8_9PAST|nr:hypothetical protein [Pasteurella atlantica]MDP8039657.1 hypothetical protein [Pasteurella atlantica]MDP8043978.1 hypothetical protein [Pasteurella atlantica]MDP8045956.1 hypothetical protein [Pasteurella atlantica]MDP8061824.1 hypothetical protein [Pasteurella atlantica]MDP8089520.1 hypothetical protein [Pasteurella atlantica]
MNIQKPLNRNNQIMLGFVSKIQETIEILNDMGLSVINLDLKTKSPVIRVDRNHITDQLEAEHKAFTYIRKGREYHEVQMQLNGCVIVWCKYLV